MSEELRELLEAPHVTPAPWAQSYHDDGRADHDLAAATQANRHPVFSQIPDNIRLIVYLRNHAEEFLAQQATIERLEGEVERLRGVVRAVQWAYPPADAVVGNWHLAARCPSCFVEWTPAEVHAADCSLGAALEEGK